MINKRNATVISNPTILENEVEDDEMYFDFKTKISILLNSCLGQMKCCFFASQIIL